MGWDTKFLSRIIPALTIDGVTVAATTAGTTNPIKVLEYSGNYKIRRAEGTDVPVNDTGGYAKGCLFVDLDVATGTSGLYQNVGTDAACNFTVIT